MSHDFIALEEDVGRELPVLSLGDARRVFRPDGAYLVSELAYAVASSRAVSKSELVSVTGLARSTISAAVDGLLQTGILRVDGARATPGRGRPATRLTLGASAGIVAVVDLAASSMRIALITMQQDILVNLRAEFDPGLAPEMVVDLIVEQLSLQRRECAPDAGLRQVVIGIPSPVDARRGVPVRPPRVPSWHDFPVAGRLAARLGCPVLLENDVNLRALGEARALPRDQWPLLFVKVGAGIGGGLIDAAGNLHHGADGGAGDIGHVRPRGTEARACVCGNTGCVEAVASLTAVARRLGGFTENSEVRRDDLDDALARVQRGEAPALAAVREAGEAVGELIAMLVHFYNPARVILGGAVIAASDEFLAAARAVVHDRALPLATRNLVLRVSELGDNAGIAGGMVLAIERALSPRGLARLL